MQVFSTYEIDNQKRKYLTQTKYLIYLQVSEKVVYGLSYVALYIIYTRFIQFFNFNIIDTT